MRHINSAADVISALGGPTVFSKWYGASLKRVTMWRVRGFPASTFKKLDNKLREEGIAADPKCWPQLED
jgi:hypothetical protein